MEWVGGMNGKGALSIHTTHPLHLVHPTPPHFTHRVHILGTAYNLNFIILVSIENDQWSRYQRDLAG